MPNLKASRASHVYRTRLKNCWDHVLLFLVSRGTSFEDIVHHPEQVDSTLEKCVNHAFRTGIQFWVAKHAVLYAQFHHPSLRFRLPSAWAALKGWQERKQTRTRLPMHRQILLILFLEGLDKAMTEPNSLKAKAYLLVAVLSRLAFMALLRPVEFLKMRRMDFAAIRRFGEKLVAIVTVAVPKTKATAGKTQFAMVHDVSTILWCEYAFQNLKADELVWPFGRQAFVVVFKELLATVGAGHIPYTLGSLRPGGATDLFLSLCPVDRIKFLGGWNSLSSLSSYLQEAASTFAWNQLAPSAQKLHAERCAFYSVLLNSPPSTPWRALLPSWVAKSKKTMRLSLGPK